MPAEAGVYVRGLRELSAAFGELGGEARREFRSEFREIAEPVRRTAEALAAEKISHIGRPWSKMRVGQTRTLVYVAPRQRGVTARGPSPRRRPNLAGLLMDKAMEPALVRSEPRIEHDVERVLDHITEQFNRGGT